MIKGAVFDMDGLMFDSERLVYEIWQITMDSLGYHYNIDIYKNTIGWRADQTKQYYTSLYGDSFDYNPIREKCRKTFLERVTSEGVPIKKGLFELLDFLKSKNIKTAVATSTSKLTATKVLSLANVYDYFDELIFGDDVKISKPDPEIYLTASKRLNLPPKNCIALEDSFNGIKSAHSAGMTTIMVPDYLNPTDEIKPLINYLCNDLSEVIEILQI